MNTFLFFSYNNLEKLFQDKLTIKLSLFYLSSIGDLIYIAEQYKKGNLNIGNKNLNEVYEQLKKEYFSQGKIHFPELDQEKVVLNLFEEDEGKIYLEKDVCNQKNSPRYSIAALCLKTNNNCYWEEDVYLDMIENFKSEFENEGHSS